MLSLFVKENQRDGDCHLPLLLMSYRSDFGRELRLPLDVLYGRHEPAKSYGDANGYADRLRDQLATVHQYAREHLKLEGDRQKLAYDHRLFQDL